MLGGHGKKDLLERIRIIVDQGQHATEAVNEMVEKATVDVGFDSVDKDREGSRQGTSDRIPPERKNC